MTYIPKEWTFSVILAKYTNHKYFQKEKLPKRRLPDSIYHLQKCQSTPIKLILFIIRNGIVPGYILKGEKKM